jgi:hypothetical protein
MPRRFPILQFWFRRALGFAGGTLAVLGRLGDRDDAP